MGNGRCGRPKGRKRKAVVANETMKKAKAEENKQVEELDRQMKGMKEELEAMKKEVADAQKELRTFKNVSETVNTALTNNEELAAELNTEETRGGILKEDLKKEKKEFTKKVSELKKAINTFNKEAAKTTRIEKDTYPWALLSQIHGTAMEHRKKWMAQWKEALEKNEGARDLSWKECQICVCEFKNEVGKCPMVLGCGHTICEGCTHRVIEKLGYRCPICRALCTSSAVVKNEALLPLI